MKYFKKTTTCILILLLNPNVFSQEIAVKNTEFENPFVTELNSIGINTNILIDLIKNEKDTNQNDRIRYLKMFFMIGYSYETDASTTEGYSSITSNLLKEIGDIDFTGAINQLPEEVKKFTLSLIIMQFGLDEENFVNLANSKLEFEKLYPKLYKEITAVR